MSVNSLLHNSSIFSVTLVKPNIENIPSRQLIMLLLCKLVSNCFEYLNISQGSVGYGYFVVTQNGSKRNRGSSRTGALTMNAWETELAGGSCCCTINQYKLQCYHLKNAILVTSRFDRRVSISDWLSVYHILPLLKCYTKLWNVVQGNTLYE